MARVKTWVWAIIGVIAIGILGIVALAAAGLWFVRSHVDVRPTTTTAAATDFDTVRTRFAGQAPLIELDDHGEFIRANTDRPAGAGRPETLHVMAFDAENEKVITMELPFWLLRLKSGGTRFSMGGEDVDLAKLRLTVEDLERFGPTLIVDHKDARGRRVLVWTQ
ncbi:MAG TPA: hypothetical protein VGI12_17975 [Vicinamibacterales bacterium]|jgi:hypothetical protein